MGFPAENFMTNFDNLNLTPEILSKLNFGVNEDTNEFFICTSEMLIRVC